MIVDELAEMIRVLNRPIPNPGISLPADVIREGLLLVFRRRCWSLAPYRMRAWWVNDCPHTREFRTYEIVRESLGGSVLRDSSRMAIERERRAERGILGRQGFSRLRDVVLKARRMVWLSQDEESADLHSLYSGGRPCRGSSRASDDLHERTYEHIRKASRDVSRDQGSGGQRSGGGSASGSRPIRKKYDDISYVLEARGSRIGGQRFGGGLGSRLRSRSRDNDFSDAEEPRGRPLGGSLRDDSDAQAIRGWGSGEGLGSGLRQRTFSEDYALTQAIRGWGSGEGSGSGLRQRSFLDDYPVPQASRGWGSGGGLGSGLRQRSFLDDYPVTQASRGPRILHGVAYDYAAAEELLDDASPRDREEYNDIMDRISGCRCEICFNARCARRLRG